MHTLHGVRLIYMSKRLFIQVRYTYSLYNDKLWVHIDKLHRCKFLRRKKNIYIYIYIYILRETSWGSSRKSWRKTSIDTARSLRGSQASADVCLRAKKFRKWIMMSSWYFPINATHDAALCRSGRSRSHYGKDFYFRIPRVGSLSIERFQRSWGIEFSNFITVSVKF